MKSKRQLCILTSLWLLSACTNKPQETIGRSAKLIMPNGFVATIVADSLGSTRHLAITPSGDIYVRLADTVKGKSTLFLQPGPSGYKVTKAFSIVGGTGIYLKDNYLYTSSNTEVYRYSLDAQYNVKDSNRPDTIVTGLIARGQHASKSLVLDNNGNLYVNIGAYSNSCQIKDREIGSLGMKPCPILDSAGGIWMFKASKLKQGYKEGVRYATGLRNVVGLDWNQTNNKLFVMQHGRDQLNTIFPSLFSEKQSAELPAECMFALDKGDNAGWPYTYYDPTQKKKMIAPEFGGDGKQEAGNEYIDPVAAYPAHLAPNGLLFYTGDLFPARYKNGAFIAFHGSWNRAPEPQAGYYVVFQPFADGKPSGDWEVFADGFTGSAENTAKGRADHRPCGLAQGPDGALYVTDDVKGTIYKIVYNQ